MILSPVSVSIDVHWWPLRYNLSALFVLAPSRNMPALANVTFIGAVFFETAILITDKGVSLALGFVRLLSSANPFCSLIGAHCEFSNHLFLSSH